jgi:hypothetical protein
MTGLRILGHQDRGLKGKDKQGKYREQCSAISHS